MPDKPGKTRIPLLYLLYGIAVTFLVTILWFWITAEVVQPIPMALFIGVFLAFIYWVFKQRLGSGKK